MNADQDKNKDSAEQWERMCGAMVVKNSGKYKHSLRVVVLSEVEENGAKKLVEVELKPSMLVRKLVIYTLCQYIKTHRQAPEVLMCTVPGMSAYAFGNVVVF